MRAKAECYQKFMKNPGFILNIEEETEVKFTLTAHKQNEVSEPYLAVSVLKIMNDFKFKFILEDNYLQGYSYQAEEITLQPSTNGYLVLCYNLLETWQGPFVLNIQSDKKIHGIRDNFKGILKLPHELKPITGTIAVNSGGHINNSSFLFNPTYQIIIEQSKSHMPFILFIELNCDSKDVPCSLYFYNT